MSDKKTIVIHPELFKFTTTQKTRKKREGGIHPIKIRTPRKENSKQARNRMLKYIRQQQEKKGKEMSGVGGATAGAGADAGASAHSGGDFASEFEESLKYLSSIAEKNDQSAAIRSSMHNTTLRHPYDPGHRGTSRGDAYDQIGTELPDVFSTITAVSAPPLYLRPPPQYGCLKGGNLPTYRMWKNQTVKYPPASTPARNPLSAGLSISPSIVVSGGAPSGGSVAERNDPPPPPTPPSSSFLSSKPAWISGGGGGNGSGEGIRPKLTEMSKLHEIKKQREKSKQMARHKRQKRTLRRTFRVGKSKYYPNVAVLVSNKTIRKQIATKSQLLKTTPMEEVKKTLIKKGLIKVGSVAPNDVLRKMYESVSLVCGDVYNHNPENLLFNYLNAGNAL